VRVTKAIYIFWGQIAERGHTDTHTNTQGVGHSW